MKRSGKSSAAIYPSSFRSLAGKWQFKLDPLDVGMRLSQWESSLDIALPGSTDEAQQGVRNESQNPYCLSRRFAYVGAAWYRRKVTVPESYRGQRTVLFLERPHGEVHAWLNTTSLGSQNSLSTPHRFELGVLEPGDYDLTLKVDNTPKIGVGNANVSSGYFNLAHSITEHTQTNWNGVVGRVELQSTPQIWLEDVQVYPDIRSGTLRIVSEVRGIGEAAGTLSLAVAGYPELNLPVAFQRTPLRLEATYAFAGAEPWNEFNPVLYTLEAHLNVADIADKRSVRFGMREFVTRGRQFYLNGAPVFLRGTLECCVFPLTGYPPTDVAAWKRLMEIAKSHGLNHLRFHSWCPPEAAFDAADELGMLLQVEGPFWAAFGSDPVVDSFAYAECDRILQCYGNHPSFCMLAVTNEPSGPQMNDFFAGILAHLRERDPRRVYTGGSGWPSIAENEFHVTPTPRAYTWGEGLRARFNALPLTTDLDYTTFISQYDVPVVSHEIGEWTAYPNFKEIDKYTGVLEPRNLKAFRASLEAKGMLGQAERFTAASGKLQALLYKEEIEAALRTPDFGGFQLLGLTDFPGQGTALVGVLDAFWDSKGYITADEWREFCSETVLLARLPKVVWQQGETLIAKLEVAHFGPNPLTNQVLSWRIITAAGVTVAEGQKHVQEIPLGSGIPLEEIAVYFELPGPERLSLHVALEGTPYHNYWDLWLYPKELAPQDDVHISRALDAKTLNVLREGKPVLLIPPAQHVKSKVPLGFTTPFWNTAWTEGQAPHTLGILCDPDHPALRSFPTHFHSSWQWQELLHGTRCLQLEGIPHDQVIIRVIDDWFTNRNLAVAFEANVLGGKLLVCSVDLYTDLDIRPVARQLRYSLLSYMQSSAFDPGQQLSIETLEAMFAPAE